MLDRFEEWAQTEWPALDVRFTSVTEQWPTIAVVGPRSRAVVGLLAPALNVSNEAFPFMTVRDTVPHLGQLRVDRRAVVALHEVLDDQLPVRPHVVDDPATHRQLVDLQRSISSASPGRAVAAPTTVSSKDGGRHPTDLPGGVDVSANRTTIELSGRHARDVLEKGCTLDLHPRAFTAGRCARTNLARARVILWQTEDAPVYRLMVRGSF